MEKQNLIPHYNFSGFPGVGKTTIMKLILQEKPAIYIPKITTRVQRPEEKEDGSFQEYLFITLEDFDERNKQNHFIAVKTNKEHDVVEKYGIPKYEYWPAIPTGTELILSTFGTQAHLAKKCSPNMKMLFISCRNMDTLYKRLHDRCMRDGSDYEGRVAKIKSYINSNIELNYDLILYNDNTPQECAQDFLKLI